MPKFFPITKTKIVQVPVGNTGEVLDERLVYDNRNEAKKAKDYVSAIIRAADVAKRSVELVTAAFAAEIQEPNKTSVDSVRVQFNIKTEVNQKASDSVSSPIQVRETNQKATDTMQTAIVPTKDTAKRASENISNTVTSISLETNQAATDFISAVVSSLETNQAATDATTTQFSTMETGQRATEDINNTVTGIVRETNQRAVDTITSAIIPSIDYSKTSMDMNTVIANYTGYVNSASQTGSWTNPNNTIGDTTGTAATITATSSGLLGATSNTSTGNLIMELENPSTQISDLDISGSVTLQIERQVTTGGTLPLGQSYNVQYQYQIVGQTSATYGSPQRTSTASGAGAPTTSSAISMVLPVKPSSTVSFVGTTGFISGSSGNAGAVIPFPSGLAVGDQLLLVAGLNAGQHQGFNFIPAGFTYLAGEGNADFTTNTNNSELVIYYKTVVSGDIGGSFTIPDQLLEGNDKYVFIAYRGCNVPNNIASHTTGTSTVMGPKVGVNGDWTFYAYVNAAGSASQPSTPAGTTGRASGGGGSISTSFIMLSDEAMVAQAAGFQTIATDSSGNVAKGFVTTTIPNLTYSQIDALQLRVVATVTSGTGLGATVTASVFRARITFTANKTY